MKLLFTTSDLLLSNKKRLTLPQISKRIKELESAIVILTYIKKRRLKLKNKKGK